MKVLESPHEIYAQVDFLRREGKTIGLIPTMGALHEGHYSLVRRSAGECDVTVATIFVNPTQFAPHEDFSKYPRTLESDLRGLQNAGAQFVFVPSVDTMYPPGHSTWVQAPSVALPLEGVHRPDHYRGVATIVLKLFQLVPATTAYFGQKDYQQALVIRRMVDDLNVPIRIEVCQTQRESDGLAMSSRNRYLDATQRQQAVGLSQALQEAQRLYQLGEHNPVRLEQAMQATLHRFGIEQIDYAKVVCAERLQDLDHIEASGSAVALIAARVGNTRLIDNMLLQEEGDLHS